VNLGLLKMAGFQSAPRRTVLSARCQLAFQRYAKQPEESGAIYPKAIGGHPPQESMRRRRAKLRRAIEEPSRAIHLKEHPAALC